MVVTVTLVFNSGLVFSHGQLYINICCASFVSLLWPWTSPKTLAFQYDLNKGSGWTAVSQTAMSKAIYLLFRYIRTNSHTYTHTHLNVLLATKVVGKHVMISKQQKHIILFGSK